MDTKKHIYSDKAIKATATFVKIIFIIIIGLTIIVTIWQFFSTEKEEFLRNIATISVGGFWAFFLGYFGWRMGQTIELYFHNLKKNR